MKPALVPLLLLPILLAAPAAGGEKFFPGKAEILPFPREVPRNASKTFVVGVKRGFFAPVFAVTDPDGRTEYHRPARTPEPGRFEFDLPFKGRKGAYRVELVVDSARGDTTAARFTVWAGVPRPAVTPGAGEAARTEWEPEDPDEHPARLERDLFRLVNEYRRSRGLRPFPWLEKAAILAREHMSDYLELKPRPKKLTHQIPGKGFLADRFEDTFAWPKTVRKFPIAEPDIGPDATCYCSESLAAPRSLEQLFTEHFLREPAFRAPIISEYPTHAGVGIVRDAKTGRLYTALVFVQVNSTRILAGLARELETLTRAERRARDDEEHAAALRLLARFGADESVKVFAKRLSDRSPAVRAAALDGLFLNDLEEAREWVERESRTLARAHERQRFGPAIPVLRTFAALLFDAPTKKRGAAELEALNAAAEAELEAAFLMLLGDRREDARSALEEIVDRYEGLPAAATAEAKLDQIRESD